MGYSMKSTNNPKIYDYITSNISVIIINTLFIIKSLLGYMSFRDPLLLHPRQFFLFYVGVIVFCIFVHIANVVSFAILVSISY